MLGVISLEKPQWKWASSTWRGVPPGFSRVVAEAATYDGDLSDPLSWPQERPVPMRVARGPLGIPLRSISGRKALCGVGAGTWGFLSSADMDLGVLLESPQGSQSSSRVGACTCAFLPSCSSSVTLPFAGIKGSVSFARGFPKRLSHEASQESCPT